MKNLHSITFLLVIIGGLNWLLYGITGGRWEIGHLLGGMNSTLSMIVYILVGLSAIVEISQHKSYCKYCEKNSRPAA